MKGKKVKKPSKKILFFFNFSSLISFIPYFLCFCHKRILCLCLDLLNLALGSLLAAELAGNHGTTTLVEFQLGDLNIAGVDADEVGTAVELGASDLLDVDDPLLAVASNNLAGLLLLALIASDDDDLIVLADGEGADVVLLAELLGEGALIMMRRMWEGALKWARLAFLLELETSIGKKKEIMKRRGLKNWLFAWAQWQCVYVYVYSVLVYSC